MEILTQMTNIIKSIGEKPAMELVKNWWIKMSIGILIMCFGLKQILPFVIDILKIIFHK